MPDRAALQALLERVQKATGPDRELDLAILRAIDPPVGGWNLVWPHYLSWDSSGAGKWAAPLTASVDAVLALIERELPGWFWTLNEAGHAFMHDRKLRGASGAGKGPTPALALLSAFLQAMIQETDNA